MAVENQLSSPNTNEEQNTLMQNQPVFSCRFKLEPIAYVILLFILFGPFIWVLIVNGWIALLFTILFEVILLTFVILIFPKRVEVWQHAVKV